MSFIKKNHTSPFRKGMENFPCRSLDLAKFVLENAKVVKVTPPLDTSIIGAFYQLHWLPFALTPTTDRCSSLLVLAESQEGNPAAIIIAYAGFIAARQSFR